MAWPEPSIEPAMFKGMLLAQAAFFPRRMPPPLVPFRHTRRFSAFRNAGLTASLLMGLRLTASLRAGLRRRAVSGNVSQLRMRGRRGRSPARVLLALLGQDCE